jgi:HAD superfamily hydrolase (TIGR01484 family)
MDIIGASSTARFASATAPDFLLATDLDGTFLGGSTAARRRLYDWLSRNRDSIGLIFVTGRDPAFIAELCADAGMPSPGHVIGDVGTTIARFEGGQVVPIPELECEIASLWGDRSARVRAALADVPGLREQETPFRYRMSYHYQAGVFAPESLAPVQDMGLDVLISHGCFVDVLPPGVSKGPSLLRLLDHLDLPHDRVLVAGDTLNDLSMFQTGLRGAVVGGSEAELRAATAALPRAHHCTAAGAAGIIEAIHAHRMHPNPPEMI